MNHREDLLLQLVNGLVSLFVHVVLTPFQQTYACTPSENMEPCWNNFSVITPGLMPRKVICYEYFDTKQNWEDAQDMCVSQRAQLMYFKSDNEYQTIRTEVTQTVATSVNKAWLGIKGLDGKYVWVHNYSALQPTELGIIQNYSRNTTVTDNSCVSGNMDSGLWAKSSCNLPKSFLCRGAPVSEPDVPELSYNTSMYMLHSLEPGSEFEVSCSAYVGWGKLAFILVFPDNSTIIFDELDFRVIATMVPFQREQYCLVFHSLDLLLHVNTRYNGTLVMCTSDLRPNQTTACSPREKTCVVLGQMVVVPLEESSPPNTLLLLMKVIYLVAGILIVLVLFATILLVAIRLRRRARRPEGEAKFSDGMFKNDDWTFPSRSAVAGGPGKVPDRLMKGDDSDKKSRVSSESHGSQKSGRSDKTAYSMATTVTGSSETKQSVKSMAY